MPVGVRGSGSHPTEFSRRRRLDAADGRARGWWARCAGAPLPVVKCVTKRQSRCRPMPRGWCSRAISTSAGWSSPKGLMANTIGYYGLVKKQSGLPPHPPSPSAKGRTVSDREHRRAPGSASPNTGPARARPRPRPRSGNVLQQAIREAGRGLLHRLIRRHVQRAGLVAPAQSRRGEERHRRRCFCFQWRPSSTCFVVDDDHRTLFSDEQIDWGRLATRFQADRDFRGSRRASAACRSIPRCRAAARAAKAGFDCTKTVRQRRTASSSRCRIRPRPLPKPSPRERGEGRVGGERQSLEAALAQGPRHLSRADGGARQLATAREEIPGATSASSTSKGRLKRLLNDGRYTLNWAVSGSPAR